MAQVHTADQRMVVHKSRHSGSWVAIQVVYWILAVIEIILALRFGLKLLGANPDAVFTQFIYGITAPFMAPFEAVFGVNQVEGSVFEWSVILAMVIYALVAWGIAALIEMIAPRSDKSVESVEEIREHEQTPPTRQAPPAQPGV